ncbi:MerR family transcriptional regulator [Rickettsiales bacterium Ac37b]|nr:MerR family transcriptional regulator [Rickettsiales bacterium Ac37b]
MVKKQDKIPVNLSNIGEVAKFVDVPQSVLRFWEKKFSVIKVHKIKGRRYYDSKAIFIIQNIKGLLYEKGYTIKGAQSFLFNMVDINSEIEKDKIEVRVCNNKEKLSEILIKLKNIKAKLEFVRDNETLDMRIE